jgi:hypothetical protein
MSTLYGQYHGRILRLAMVSTADGAWKPKLREILAEFDEECRRLSSFSNNELRHELASQIEHEVLSFRDAEKRKVLVLAIKHLDVIEE